MLAALLRRFASFASRPRPHGFVPPGHFYSPIVSIQEMERDAERIFRPTGPPAGIEMNEAGQLELLASFENIYPSIDFPRHRAAPHRYFYENPAYSYSDAIMLHCMMRHFRPRRIIEIGSGYSSCAMLDTRERHLDAELELTFIEPFPALLQSLICPSDQQSITIVPTRLQDVGLDRFRALQSGDFLFVDSTHVSKTGSDVNYLFFEVLPALAAGVHIHIHDAFYPFEYPKEWIVGGRSWNEQYVLRAFLQFNEAFSVSLMNTYLQKLHRPRFAATMPLCLENTGGSIWLRKNR